MTIKISNFYLNSLLPRQEFVEIKINDSQEEIIKEYKLRDKVTPQGYVHIMATKGMYGLPQAGLIANKLLEKRLNKHGYRQSKLVPGLWKHDTRPIKFTLVVDDFGVKYVGEEHIHHLQRVLKQHYYIKSDWSGQRYIGITLFWEYQQ